MNRHLSKARRTDTGDWVVGYYRCQPNFKRERHLIQTYKENLVVEIDFNTLCRNTGHPNNIYEGDEVNYIKFTGFVKYEPKFLSYNVVIDEDVNLLVDSGTNWQPTGKNIYD